MFPDIFTSGRGMPLNGKKKKKEKKNTAAKCAFVISLPERLLETCIGPCRDARESAMKNNRNSAASRPRIASGSDDYCRQSHGY